ncbi:MAG: hypothetical protein KGN84_02290, partial [Acidobacteriota bacterium]|nr:hypothetical protein [Acidobacteriota bacterium]
AIAAAKSYQVETRDGSDWRPLASFAIEIATCKIKPGELKEPVLVNQETPDKADEPKDNPEEELHAGSSAAQTVNPKPSTPTKKGPLD